MDASLNAGPGLAAPAAVVPDSPAPDAIPTAAALQSLSNALKQSDLAQDHFEKQAQALSALGNHELSAARITAVQQGAKDTLAKADSVGSCALSIVSSRQARSQTLSEDVVTTRKVQCLITCRTSGYRGKEICSKALSLGLADLNKHRLDLELGAMLEEQAKEPYRVALAGVGRGDGVVEKEGVRFCKEDAHFIYDLYGEIFPLAEFNYKTPPLQRRMRRYQNGEEHDPFAIFDAFALDWTADLTDSYGPTIQRPRPSSTLVRELFDRGSKVRSEVCDRIGTFKPDQQGNGVSLRFIMKADQLLVIIMEVDKSGVVREAEIQVRGSGGLKVNELS